jgi:hypothetical protein
MLPSSRGSGATDIIGLGPTTRPVALTFWPSYQWSGFVRFSWRTLRISVS